MLTSLGEMKAPWVGLPKIADVTHYNYCTSCGTCEAICPVNAPVVRRETVDVSRDKQNYRKIELKTEIDFQGKNVFLEEVNPCVNCYACERVCPVLDGFEIDEFRNIRKMYAVRSPIFQGQDGAAVSQILYSLLEQGEIDCVLSVTRDHEWNTRVIVLTSPEDVKNVSGTKYTYEPVVASLREIHRDYFQGEGKYKKIAVVGTPCQVHGARLFQENTWDRIKLLIGLFCMESFSSEIMHSEIIPSIMGVDIRDVVKMNFHAGKFIVETKDGEEKKVPIKKVAPLARHGCHHCIDYTSCFADISVGSVGTGEGWSTVFVRTETGERYLEKVAGLEYSDQEINLGLVKKLADMKHKNNNWDWQGFLREVWNRDVPPRPWGKERLARRGLLEEQSE